MKQIGIHKAVKAAGSQADLARKLGVSTVLINRWVKRGWVSRDFVPKLESDFGIPRHELIDPRLLALVVG